MSLIACLVGVSQQVGWYDFDRINLVRFLSTGESRLTDMWPLLIMLICLKVPVANLLLLSLKVGSLKQCGEGFLHSISLDHLLDKFSIHFYRLFLLNSSWRTKEL